MPEIIIKYNSPGTLKILKDLSKFLGFAISPSSSVKKKTLTKEMVINGVKMLRGNGSVDNEDMIEIISKNNFDAKELRAKAWQRRK